MSFRSSNRTHVGRCGNVGNRKSTLYHILEYFYFIFGGGLLGKHSSGSVMYDTVWE